MSDWICKDISDPEHCTKTKPAVVPQGLWRPLVAPLGTPALFSLRLLLRGARGVWPRDERISLTSEVWIWRIKQHQHQTMWRCWLMCRNSAGVQSAVCLWWRTHTCSETTHNEPFCTPPHFTSNFFTTLVMTVSPHGGSRVSAIRVCLHMWCLVLIFILLTVPESASCMYMRSTPGLQENLDILQ